MTSTLQTNFKNNTNTYIMKTPENQAVKKDDTNVKNTQPKESEKSKSKDGNILLYSLGGLAVIGFGYLAGKKFLVKVPKSEQNNSGCNLLDIMNAKEKIKNEIIEKRQALLAEINANRSQYDTSAPYESGRDIINRLKQAQNVHQKDVDELVPLKNKKMAAIRAKLQELASDEDWQFLRSTRKNLIKIVNGSYPKNARSIAYNKVLLVNDLLINKVYPEEQKAFLNFHGFSHEDGINLIKTKFSKKEDYSKARDELIAKSNAGEIILTTRQRNFKHYMPLTLIDIFPDEARVCKACNHKLYVSSGKLNVLKKAYKDYLDGLKQIATEYRTSENVNALKNAVAGTER